MTGYHAGADLSTPAAHGELLHAGRPGRVALARKVGSKRGDWEEQAYDISDLPDVLPAVAGESDVYLSTQRFWGWRRIAQLAECGALAVDVDFHKLPELAGMHPRGVLDDAVSLLERNGMPAPSLAISSGRGLYLLWLHDPIPRAALPRWNRCQRELWRVLSSVGADRGALDAARVLRIVGTQHSKAGVIVEALTAPGDVWDFGDLADEILPHTRAELHDLRIQRAARDAEKPREGRRGAPEGYTAATLWEARLADLQTLRRLRWFGEMPPGHRDHWMLLAGCAMSWLAEPVILRRELYALARECAGWEEREARSRMQSIFKRAHMAARGEHVEWEGVEVDPRYRFRSQTILELLEITPEEERHMLTIISADERRCRDRNRKKQERRESGEVKQTRDEYESRATERREEAARLRSEGLSYRKIAARLEVSHEAVRKMLSAEARNTQTPLPFEENAPAFEGCQQSVRLYGGVAPAEGGTGRAEGPTPLERFDDGGEVREVREVLEVAEERFGASESFGRS